MLNITSLRFKNILLFSLPLISPHHTVTPSSPNRGIGYIAETLRRNNIKYNFVDLRLSFNAKNFFKLISRVNPDLIGTSMYSLGYKRDYTLLEKVKTLYPNIAIVAGGPHITCYKEKILEDCPAIDYGITFEGDNTIIDLCSNKPLADIPGLLYRHSAVIKYTGDRPFIRDLDSLGFPHFEGFDLKSYSNFDFALTTSRGCFGQCTFCAVSCALGKSVRWMSAKLVVDEIVYWYKKGYRIISFLDDNFITHRNRVIEFCEILKSKNLKGLQLKLANGVRADCVDREILQLLFSVGINKISFGVESANDNILRNIKKNESVETIKKAVQLALEVGMQVSLTFIIGLPGETEKEVRNSFEFANTSGAHNAVFYVLIPYPGTELFEWASSHGYFLYPPEEYLNFNAQERAKNLILIETPELSAKDRLKLHIESANLEKRLRKKMQLKVLGPKIGNIPSKLLLSIFHSDWFIKVRQRSSIVNRFLTRIRILLNI